MTALNTRQKAARIVELFCGRGNGLHALQRLGFNNIEGVDLSPTLAAEYTGGAHVTVADCRQIPLPSSSRDVLIVQGGLHHLPRIPSDLETTLGEAQRLLRPNGLFLAVEPWLTPFLRLIHALGRNRLVRKASPKFDALATMIQYEEATYLQWLEHPQVILDLLRARFQPDRVCVRFGKILFVGRKRPDLRAAELPLSPPPRANSSTPSF